MHVMLCLGIESTAHTFGCSIIEIDKKVILAIQKASLFCQK